MNFTTLKENFLPFVLLICSAAVIIGFQIISGGFKGKVICFGDSITHGAFVEGHGWVEQIDNKSKDVQFINAGRNGRKTSDTTELAPVLKKYPDADYALFLLGVNDLKDGNDSMVNACVKNMKWMIGQVKIKIPNAKIVLMAPCRLNLDEMSDVNKNKKYNVNTQNSLIELGKRYKLLAEEESVGFIDLFNTVSMENYIDGLHPNIDGYRQMADEIWNRLNSIFN